MNPPAPQDANVVKMQIPQHTAAAKDSATRAAGVAGLKKRMRIFVEAIVKMVSPVFLAVCVSLAKVDMGNQPRVRDSLSPLAVCTLGFGILSLLPIIFPNWFPQRLYPFRFSMSFIHLCGVLLMVLAYLALILISKTYAPLGIFLVVMAIVVLVCGIMTVCNGPPRGATRMSEKCLDDLENSVDFLAAITFLLFLGLGGLMLSLRGQYITIQQDEEMPLLLFIIMTLSFFFFLAGVTLMLVAVVPPDNGRDEHTCDNVNVYNYIFGCALALIVMLITLGKLGCWYASALALALSVLPFAVFVKICDAADAIGRGDDEEVKPASLDLTKVTFTGFFSISVYTITPLRVHELSSWLIFFTAIAVNNSLGWRLLTHQKHPPAARFTAASFASLCAHIYTTISVILFGFMAFNAFRKITADAPSPAHMI